LITYLITYQERLNVINLIKIRREMLGFGQICR
jgi:hypothetical protein